MKRTRNIAWAVTCAGLVSVILAVVLSASVRAQAPPSHACDASTMSAGGSFASTGNAIQFTLVNRSAAPRCVATRMMVLFEYPVRAEAVRIASPVGWQSRFMRCAGSDYVCGVAWDGQGGVAAGASLAGFGVAGPSNVLPRGDVIDVGDQTVVVPGGVVGG